jgi:hypothetical protein
MVLDQKWLQEKAPQPFFVKSGGAALLCGASICFKIGKRFQSDTSERKELAESIIG